jgi:uncharacterized glyoxalase superfamily protein PhnB
MKARLYGTRVFTTDFDAAVRFYSETVGLPVLFGDTNMGWAEFDTGDAHLCLERIAPEDKEREELVGRFVGVSLQVDDMDAAYEELCAAGVTFEAPPEDQPWGGVLAHFRDPDGNVLTLLGS